jgi:hypothetical protein
MKNLTLYREVGPLQVITKSRKPDEPQGSLCYLRSNVII